ncbi:hypothetical protein IAR55_001111 [Kwoniella newhampshirensis]|uniref:SH3 domain-containing protein n=1 Tax=Kwoniella newhampshirensis TaxID=1651941 RepID=A0AAW0Z4T7_9TREE
MFANLTYEAFFSLLDEYFTSRPQNRPSTSTNPSPVSSTVVSSSTTTRSLPPPNRSPAPPLSPPPSAGFGGGGGGGDQDLAQRFISQSIRLGTAGTKAGVGAVSKNKDAMDLLGKVGAAGMMRGANSRLNSGSGTNDQNASITEIDDNQGGGGGGRGPPPPVQKKKHGVAGLVSGKSFGHVDTSSKMSAFTSMWKDPQKVQTPVVEHHQGAVLSHTPVALPPPSRRNTSQHSSPAETDGQAQALYDYSGADAGDLSVQANQIVNVIEQTSNDWWTCEDGNGTRGLVPATYLKAL